MVIRDELGNEWCLSSHGTNQSFPGIDAVSDMVILCNIHGIVLSLSHLFESENVLGTRIGIPSPVANFEEALREGGIEAVFWGPELHHDIEDTASISGLLGAVATVLNDSRCKN